MRCSLGEWPTAVWMSLPALPSGQPPLHSSSCIGAGGVGVGCVCGVCGVCVCSELMFNTTGAEMACKVL